MSRVRVSVRELAIELGRDVKEVISLLMEEGLNVERPDDVVSRKHCGRARRALGLPARPSACLATTIGHLADRSGLSEDDVRDRLRRAGIISKRCLRRVPRGALVRAETLLGLRPPKTPIDPPKMESA